jgi:UDP-2,3-diacylglucosamine hydrolase
MLSLEIDLLEGKKLYFASDFHLGTPSKEASFEREKKIVKWLGDIEKDAQAIFFLGDQFDFWFEYRHVIPKGFSLFISKLVELRQLQIPLYFFTGNHDMWMFDYFPDELGIPIFRNNMVLKVGGKKILLGHGDGLGPGDLKYKFLKLLFNSPVCQKLFAFLHPWIGFSIATRWSTSSRIANTALDEVFMGEKERIWIYCKQMEQKQHHDYYLFGHRHLVLDLEVGENSRYLNLGEWVTGTTYAMFDGQVLTLQKAEE